MKHIPMHVWGVLFWALVVGACVIAGVIAPVTPEHPPPHYHARVAEARATGAACIANGQSYLDCSAVCWDRYRDDPNLRFRKNGLIVHWKPWRECEAAAQHAVTEVR